MNRVIWERFKFYTLIALILISLAQVGILLSYQYHGFPNYFFGSLLKGKKSVSATVDKDDFFSPSRIIVSKGEDDFHWIIDKENNNKFYTTFFKDAQLYLGNILRMEMIKDKRTQPLDQTKIENLAGKYSISIEFKADINKDIMALFLNIKDVSNDEISSIKRIIILPSEDPNSNCTIEIIDELNKKIHEYVMPFQITGKEKEDYKKLIDELGTDENLIDYWLIKEINIAEDSKELKFSSDILFVASRKYSMYNTIDCLPPKEFEIKNTYEELMDLAAIVLEDQKDIYIPSVDVNGAAVFKNTDSTYKVYNDGLLEYSYFSSSKEEIDKGSVEDAYIRTLKFMDNKIGLVTGSGAEIFLSGIKELKDGYRFTFDYKVAGLPVYMVYPVNGKEKKPLKNAITVEATGNRVLSCQWVFKDFVKKNKNNYSMYVNDMMDNLEYEPTGKNSILNIKNIEVCYKVSGNKLYNIEPVWKLDTDTGDAYTVIMAKK